MSDLPQGKAGGKVTEQFKLSTITHTAQAPRYDESLWLIRNDLPGAAQALYEQLQRSNLPTIQRATLLAELPSYPSEQALKLATRDLSHSAPQVRVSALRWRSAHSAADGACTAVDAVAERPGEGRAHYGGAGLAWGGA